MTIRYARSRSTSSSRGSPSSVCGAGQQQLRLELEQPGCHPEKLAGHLEIEFLHGADVFVVLVADAQDGDVIDRDLVLSNEVQQQIQRTAEERQLDRWSQRDDRQTKSGFTSTAGV